VATTTTDQLFTALSDRYAISRELGAGGMATVYLAHDVKHGRDVAIKVLHNDLSVTLGRDRFLREIQLAARLSHPHVLPLYDSGEAAGMLYYVMPVVRGESLRDLLRRDRQLPIADAVRIVSATARALAHAHEQGIVHRDVKPENILLQDDHVFVADFGIGKAISEMGDEAMTHTGMSVGTPAYLSPEQAAGEPVDGRSDQYALACVLYETLVGEPPFTGPNVQAVVAKRFVQTPADVTALREGVPRSVARALQRAIARTPIDRFPTMSAFADALLATDDIGAPRADDPPARSIAVLPFVNLSADRENEYLGDGIAEDITNALASIDALHVAARASAFSFKNKNAEPREIGHHLRVATILEGSIRRSGSRIRITAQLVAVNDAYQLWSERYDRELVDVFAVQDEIATAIAKRLQLTFAASTPSATASAAEVEAYELLVRGRALTAQRGRPILDAIAALEQALQLTPNDPNVHAALGNAWRVREQYGLGTRAECHPRAYEHLRKALALDPNHAEAMGYLASLIVTKEDLRRRDEGIELFRRALAVNPRLSELRGNSGAWTNAMAYDGRDDIAAVQQVERSLADDPLNPICSTIYVLVMGIVGRTKEAVDEGIRACAREPGAFAPHYALAWAHTWARNTEQGITFTQAAMERFGRHPWMLQVMTGLFMQRGDRRRAEAVHAELEARAQTSFIPFFSLAVSAIYLGRIEEGFEFALKSAEARDGIGPMWVRFPDIEPVLTHPRYPEILAAMGA
jgi:serine/threonine protein kinase/Tfp pilus assembly protein PilF